MRVRPSLQHVDDAFTLLRQAVDLLPEDAAAENGQTVGDVREDIVRQEGEMTLGVLVQIGDVHPVSADFWELRHGTVRATQSLVGAEEGRRRTAFAADGRLRPMWDIGNRTAGGERELNIATAAPHARRSAHQRPPTAGRRAVVVSLVS
ncbi:hypothetical protein [Streptomyces sp. 900105755]